MDWPGRARGRARRRLAAALRTRWSTSRGTSRSPSITCARRGAGPRRPRAGGNGGASALFSSEFPGSSEPQRGPPAREDPGISRISIFEERCPGFGTNRWGVHKARMCVWVGWGGGSPEFGKRKAGATEVDAPMVRFVYRGPIQHDRRFFSAVAASAYRSRRRSRSRPCSRPSVTRMRRSASRKSTMPQPHEMVSSGVYSSGQIAAS